LIDIRVTACQTVKCNWRAAKDRAQTYDASAAASVRHPL